MTSAPTVIWLRFQIAAVLEELVVVRVILADVVVTGLGTDHQVVREEVINGRSDPPGLDPGEGKLLVVEAVTIDVGRIVEAHEAQRAVHVGDVLAAEREARALGDPEATGGRNAPRIGVHVVVVRRSRRSARSRGDRWG